MKAWLSVDMEGISGIADRTQLIPGERLYGEGRARLVGDLQAAVSALQEAGADEIVVNDSHDGMLNLAAEDVAAGVSLISGGPKAWSMNAGGDAADFACFIGYHARAGAFPAVMDHTYSGEILAVRLNGREVGETGLNAALLGGWGVPVIVVTGDQAVAHEARDLLGDAVTTVVVKTALSRRAARLLDPATAQARIRAGVLEAVERYRRGAVAPFVLPSPILLEIDLATTDMTDRAAFCPGVQRIAGRTVRFRAGSMEAAFRAFYTVMVLASGRPLY